MSQPSVTTSVPKSDATSHSAIAGLEEIARGLTSLLAVVERHTRQDASASLPAQSDPDNVAGAVADFIQKREHCERLHAEHSIARLVVTARACDDAINSLVEAREELARRVLFAHGHASVKTVDGFHAVAVAAHGRIALVRNDGCDTDNAVVGVVDVADIIDLDGTLDAKGGAR